MLTHEQYFSKENRYLSNSKLNDYFKSPEYFYRKHITKEIVQGDVDAFVIGKAVDCWLTEGKQVFENRYLCVSRRNLKNPPTGMIELNNTQYNMAVGLAQSVERTSAYKEVKRHKAQVILTEDFPIGKWFTGLCGVPDWYQVNGTHAIITDLKTTMNVDPYKYFYACLDYGYFRQQAMYQRLLKHQYPEIETFESRHIVVEKDTDGIHDVKCFILDQEMIEIEKEIIQNAVIEIGNRENFNRADVSFSSAKILGQKDEF